jgi:hypothetical protein
MASAGPAAARSRSATRVGNRGRRCSRSCRSVTVSRRPHRRLLCSPRRRRAHDRVGDIPTATARAPGVPSEVSAREATKELLPMQPDDLGRVSSSLLSARSAFRPGSWDDRFHDRPTDSGALPAAPPAPKLGGRSPLVLSPSSSRQTGGTPRRDDSFAARRAARRDDRFRRGPTRSGSGRRAPLERQSSSLADGHQRLPSRSGAGVTSSLLRTAARQSKCGSAAVTNEVCGRSGGEVDA